MRFRFTEEQFAYASAIGRQRNSITSRTHPDLKLDPDQTDEEAHSRGARAEYAVHIVTRGSWTPLRTGPDPGYEIVLSDGRTVDVKGRKLIPEPKMFYLYHGYLTADIGVLVEDVESRRLEVEILGWIPREDFRSLAKTRDFGRGRGPQPYIYASELRTMHGLMPRVPIGLEQFV